MRKRSKDQSPNAPKETELWLPAEPGRQETNTPAAVTEREMETTHAPDPANAQTPAGRLIGLVPESSWSRHRLVLEWRLNQTQDWLRQQMQLEQDQRGGFLWIPVLLASGIVLYFQLPREPWLYAFPIFAAAIAALAVVKRGSPTSPVLWALALIALGTSLAQWRTNLLNTVMLDRHVVAHVSGQVLRAEQRSNGRVRYTLGHVKLEPERAAPQRVRLTTRQSDQVFAIGDMIEGRARIGPPPGPALPGGYDFRFFAWFAGIGGSGFYLGHPQLVPAQQLSTIPKMDAMMQVNALRQQIGQILHGAMPDQGSALATALIIGERSGIDETTNEALRRAGLAHILAISGLHMALVSLTIIGLVRLIGASQMDLAVYYPIKKWAGCLGLFCATIYLFLSGASLSTQRAYIMVAVMLLAVLVDRRALTMRNVSVAAIIVLLFTPEAVLHPGFQMSFAAVAALVGTFELLSKRAGNRLSGMSVTRWNLFRLRAGNYLFGLALVPLIAGLSTGLFAAYHFYRIAPLGLLANVLAMPLVSLAVMPLALFSVLLMPFGLEQLALTPMGWALQLVVDIAVWVAELSPVGATGYIPAPALSFGSMALAFATLCRSHLKLLALPCAIAAAMITVDRPQPDFIISENGRQVGLFLTSKQLILSKPKAEKFTTRLWRDAYGAEQKNGSLPANSHQNHRRCDRFGCVLKKSGLVVVHVQNTSRLSEDCLQADVLVVPYKVPWACRHQPEGHRPIVIDATALETHGAHTIYRSDKAGPDSHKAQLTILTARRNNGRMWSRYP
ncbi:MAG: ComEC/Rec2 family competence protein [Rhizobiaceae bacterium]